MKIFIEGRDFAAGEIIGDRKEQEDFNAFLLLNDGKEVLAILADGMGGHEAGEVASRLAVESFARCFERHSAGSVSARLGAALQAADNVLAEHIKTHPNLRGMGCTLVAIHLSQNELHWISVGDSPLFVLSGRRLKQVNEDHSMAPEIERSLRAGKITEEEAASHPHRNALRSALMGEGTPQLIDSPKRPMGLKKGDVILLASDGLQTLPDYEIERVLLAEAGKGTSNGVAALLRAVENKRKRNQDNTTVQIIRLPADPLGKSSRNKWSRVVLFLMLFAALAFSVYLFLSRNNFSSFAPAFFQPSNEAGYDLAADKENEPAPIRQSSDQSSKNDQPEDLPDVSRPPADEKPPKAKITDERNALSKSTSPAKVGEEKKTPNPASENKAESSNLKPVEKGTTERPTPEPQTVAPSKGPKASEGKK